MQRGDTCEAGRAQLVKHHGNRSGFVIHNTHTKVFHDQLKQARRGVRGVAWTGRPAQAGRR